MKKGLAIGLLLGFLPGVIFGSLLMRADYRERIFNAARTGYPLYDSGREYAVRFQFAGAGDQGLRKVREGSK